jgi:hypothetical protein
MVAAERAAGVTDRGCVIAPRSGFVGVPYLPPIRVLIPHIPNGPSHGKQEANEHGQWDRLTASARSKGGEDRKRQHRRHKNPEPDDEHLVSIADAGPPLAASLPT